MSFSSFDLDPRLLRGVADLGFTDPTPIQRDAMPPALEGRDVLACAMTGSGKTAAFALPILQHLLGKPRGVTRALVLAPTRELAAQIVDHFNDLGKHAGIRAAAVYGGVAMGPQEKALRNGTDVIVACPGRLLDHSQYLERHGVSCDRVHGNRSQPQRTQALADFKSGRTRILVATDIAQRGIDIEGLSHVVNFDVPNVPEDYIHRVGRTARAGATGDAITFVSPEEMGELRAIERAVAKVLPRKTLEGFDYAPKTAEKLEIPIAERLAAMRSQRSGERARANANAAARNGNGNANARNDRKPQSAPAGRGDSSHPSHARPSTPRPAAARTQESHRRGTEPATMNPWPGRSAAPGPQRAASPGPQRRRLR